MKLAILGNNDGPLRLAKSLLAQGLTPVAVGLQKEVPEGLIQEYLKVLQADKIFYEFDEKKAVQHLGRYSFDLLVNCFCNFKFKVLLQKHKTLNVHLSALPKYRGRHPLHWALINGEKEIGVSIHEMTSAFDAGAIYWQKRVKIEAGISVQEARELLMGEVEKHFGKFINDFSNGKIQPLPNRDKEATYIPKRKPEDSLLTEWDDADLLFRKVMALRSENDSAFIKKDDQIIRITNAKICLGDALDIPGTIVTVDQNRITVATGNGKRIALSGFEPSELDVKINDSLL